ncbi:LuxR C-terminal-related transcriptional regulator [Actinokineospora bangkokensis]|uniref:LuxR C-terminal-related transcriptional regulator n=1 Tax=Actinokineospora bangkokensis TaxID=1193682 RepID=UPI0013017387|nr:LuxR C-terminal-related transcriptional regulator [Actinokineospora bangkokensis]
MVLWASAGDDGDDLLATARAALDDARARSTGGGGVRAGARSQVVLVVDQVEGLRDPTVSQEVSTLLRSLPAGLRVVLSGRVRPPLHLARLRLEGHLREIDDTELRFTRAEARALLSAHRAQPTEAELDRLMEWTRGWAAGLVFTAARSTGPAHLTGARALRATGLDHYLDEEVLAYWSARERRLLELTSICEVVTAELATAVTGMADAAALLHRIRAADALVVETEDGYRLHPILRDHLHNALSATSPGNIADLHRAAAAHLLDHGAALRAAEHALHARETALATGIVTEEGLREVLQGGGHRMLTVTSALPEAARRTRSVGATAALAALDDGDVVAADRILATLSPGGDSGSDALLGLVSLYRSRFGGEPDRVWPLPDDQQTGALGFAIRLHSAVAELWAGRPESARQRLDHLVESGRDRPPPWLTVQAHAHLGAAALLTGSPTDAAAHAERATSLAAAHGWTSRWPAALAAVVAGAVAFLRGNTDRAAALIAPAVPVLVRRAETTLSCTAHWLDALVRFDSAAQPRAVAERAHRWWARHRGTPISRPVVAMAAPGLVRIMLQVGEPGWAADLVRDTEPILTGWAEHSVLRALVQLHHGRVARARGLLVAVLEQTSHPVVPTTLVDAWVLEALLADRAGDRARAHTALLVALRHAAPMAAPRPILAAGPAVRGVLVRGLGRFGEHEAFVEGVLTRLAPLPGAGSPLTGRELQLLARLPSMATIAEIAEAEFVSTNTVKTHLRGIYRKLAVRHRRDAVLVARRLGLL